MCSRVELEKKLNDIPAEYSYPGCDHLRTMHKILHGKPIKFSGDVKIQSQHGRASDVAIGFATELSRDNPYAPRILELSQELLETHEGVVNHQL